MILYISSYYMKLIRMHMYSVDGYGRKVRKLLLRTVISESSSIVAGDGISGKYCTVLYETFMFY